MDSIEKFLANDEYNLREVSARLPYFTELMPQIHSLYSRAIELVPQAAEAQGVLFSESLLLCHKGFLCSAATIARRHPDDAASISRRTIEVASLAVAVKSDPGNFERWQAGEARMRRWAERRAGKKPRPFYPDVKYPENPRLEKLRSYLGVLSDGFVHYTPEFAAGQNWEKVKQGDGGYLQLPYLTTDQAAIEHQCLLLGTIHIRILDLLGECFDGLFAKDKEWATIRKDVGDRLAALATSYAAAHPTVEQERPAEEQK